MIQRPIEIIYIFFVFSFNFSSQNRTNYMCCIHSEARGKSGTSAEHAVLREKKSASAANYIVRNRGF